MSYNNTKTFRVAAAMLFAFALLGGAACLQAIPAWADEAASTQATQADGWNAGKTKYFKNGVAVTGARKIKGKWYAFSGKGNLMKKTFKLDGVTYYPGKDGKLRARKIDGVYCYNNGVRMTKGDKLDFKCLLYAEKVVKKLTNTSDSMATKRLKVFRWMMKKGYAEHRTFSYNRVGWPAIYAMDQLSGRGGDCVSDGTALAYLFAAIGYKNVYACTDTTATYADPHCWAMIGNRVFDSMFAEVKSFSTFYNSAGGSYEVNPAQRFAIPMYNPSHAGRDSAPMNTKASTSKNGLYVKDSGTYYYVKGKKVTSAWKTVDGKRYYFKSNGKAATKSQKIKGVYYVFNTKGRLLKGSKTRTVTVDGVKYRVKANGKAYKGFNDAKTYYYLPNGTKATGVRFMNDKLYYFSAKGKYSAEKTKALRAATKMDGDVAELLKLLGSDCQLKKMQEDASCYCGEDVVGTDYMYTYEYIRVGVFVPKEGDVWLLEFISAK